MSIPIYWVVVGFAHILGNARRLRLRDERAARLEASLARSRLEALQSQLQPHFLFNTLNAISALIPADPRAAEEMVADLADLLRITLARRTTTECRLDEELEVLDRYLAIMRMRFKDRLSIEREVDPACPDALVPAFILQPIVENAIEHGIARASQPGRVTIRARRRDGWLCIEVQDNGPGLAALESGKIREGVGLSNTRSRLEALHGNSQRMELLNLPDGGCCARIEIPFRTARPS